ncbi:alpha/beta hydrolase [Proteiniclasticum ruminis]|uniref:Predicted hydrolase of the alpha/beta superfamily n=1 Tax=Proteiniclasticum ruminis TaxID=398199 RepID=A0A1I5EII8_9CLOT|nr:alpha/beta hydrolase-fold protein [Proteiniclasticum ruminis]SFO11339.1 Predicted hydrolase of the alpha/beta superfamily [Proteiniclasticum ruminis]
MKREDIHIEMLSGEKRRVRLLLPERLKAGEKVPVLYMFDGQNLFEKEDAFGGVTWGVQEALEALIDRQEALPMAVVGIDNAGACRLDEYGPWPFIVENYSSAGEGGNFAKHFIERILPLLEKEYPLKTEREYRALAGSSMGGLMTSYIGATYPEMFGTLGVFSLASWVSEEPFIEMLEKEGEYRNARIFLQVGTEEEREAEGKVDYEHSQTYIDNSMRFLKKALKKGASLEDLMVKIGAGKTHNEGAWASYMEEFIQYVQKPYFQKD